MEHSPLTRLDQHLVDLQLAETRTKASHLIENGWVSVNGKVQLQKSLKVSSSDLIELNSNKRIYISQDGYKLEKAVKNFKLELAGKTILDIGDKTGGLADCALQHEAKLVTIVNIGESRIHETIRVDNRVVLLDKTDIRLIEPSTLPVQSFDLVVVDIAFSSLESVFPTLHKFLHSKSRLITILKPQLGEPERRLHNNGIIKTEKIRFAGIEKVQEHILNNGYEIIKMTTMDHKDKRSEILVLLESTQ